MHKLCQMQKHIRRVLMTGSAREEEVVEEEEEKEEEEGDEEEEEEEEVELYLGCILSPLPTAAWAVS